MRSPYNQQMLTGKGLVFHCFPPPFSLSQLSRSPLCPNRKLHGEVAALHTEKKLANGLKALAHNSLKSAAWLTEDLLIRWLHTSQPPFYVLWRKGKIQDLWQRAQHPSPLELNHSNQHCGSMSKLWPSLFSGLCLITLALLQKWNYQSPWNNTHPYWGPTPTQWQAAKRNFNPILSRWRKHKDLFYPAEWASQKWDPHALYKSQKVRAERRCSFLG